MSSTSKLRWALYEGAYQPALVFPPEELGDAEIPLGYSVVYLLGLDTNAVVAESDVTDYDPQDTQKTSNPAAAAGVAMAQQILGGFQKSSTTTSTGGQEGGHENTRAAAGAFGVEDNLEEEDDGVTEADLRLLLNDQDAAANDRGDDDEEEDAEARRRRRHEEKKLRKEEKKKAKEAKKAAKAAVKREREDITSAPTLRRRNASSDDDDDENSEDEDNQLLAAMAIEKKYSRAGKSGHRNDAEEEEDEEGQAGHNRHSGSGNGAKVKKEKKTKTAAAEEDPWAALEEEFMSGEDDDDADDADGARGRRAGDAGPARSFRSGNRMGQALAALHSTAGVAHNIPGLATSCAYAYPYLMQIFGEYDALTQEAANEGMLLTMQKGELVREIDNVLRQRAAQRSFLDAVLRAREEQSEPPQDANNDSASAEAAISEAMEKLEAPLDIPAAVRGLVGKQMPPQSVAFDRSAAARVQRAVQRRTRTFQDASVVMLVDHLRSVDAAPRDDGAEVMRRYIQQRRQHEELKTNFRGLSKTGFYAVPKPLEKWRRARDMMVLANVGAEAQKVLPTSYISQAHSTMLRRMKDHAEKRYDRMAVAARDGASFLDAGSFGMGAGRALSNTVDAAAAAGGFGAPSPSMHSQEVLLQQRQQRLAAAASGTAQRREAFFQFHNLRCDVEAPVALESVNLNAGFAGTGMSQNVLASVEDVLASHHNGPSFGADNSVHTDDGNLSQQSSYSVHSATPSSYPFVFDAEPSVASSSRRPHHHRRHRSQSREGGGGRDASEVNSGVSATSSRAASVNSAYDDGEEPKKTSADGAHHRRGGGARDALSTTADWRSSAKRSIMEQLTLYCRGRGGKPAILSSDQCREIGRTLLDRAMRAEAERQGISLAVQSNNIAAPFTKTTEHRLKKSVDHYLERRMAQNALPGSAAVGASAGGAGVLGAGQGMNAGVLQMPAEGYDTAAARQRAVADTPIYEN